MKIAKSWKKGALVGVIIFVIYILAGGIWLLFATKKICDIPDHSGQTCDFFWRLYFNLAKPDRAELLPDLAWFLGTVFISGLIGLGLGKLKKK